jgi:hypothetical protein
MRVLIGIAVVLLALWLLGLVLRIATGLIHLALVVAIILFIVGWLRRPKSTAP